MFFLEWASWRIGSAATWNESDALPGFDQQAQGRAAGEAGDVSWLYDTSQMLVASFIIVFA